MKRGQRSWTHCRKQSAAGQDNIRKSWERDFYYSHLEDCLMQTFSPALMPTSSMNHVRSMPGLIITNCFIALAPYALTKLREKEHPGTIPLAVQKPWLRSIHLLKIQYHDNYLLPVSHKLNLLSYISVQCFFTPHFLDVTTNKLITQNTTVCDYVHVRDYDYLIIITVLEV